MKDLIMARYNMKKTKKKEHEHKENKKTFQ